MNFLHPQRRLTTELFEAVFKRGAEMGRDYDFLASHCGEGPYRIPAVRIKIIEKRKGTFFQATTPFLCRGKIIDCQADFYEAEFERPIEAEEIGAEHEPIPPPRAAGRKKPGT